MLLIDANTRVKPEGLGFDKYYAVTPAGEHVKGTGVEIITENMQDFEKQLRKHAKEKPVILTTSNYDVKRAAVERALVDFIAHNELAEKPDSKTYRYSGVDQVIAKKCAQTKVGVNICFNDFLNSKNRGATLGRMRQNVKLCLKYGAPIIISSGAAHKNELVPADNLVAFAEFLGMNKKQARESLNARISEK